MENSEASAGLPLQTSDCKKRLQWEGGGAKKWSGVFAVGGNEAVWISPRRGRAERSFIKTSGRNSGRFLSGQSSSYTGFPPQTNIRTEEIFSAEKEFCKKKINFLFCCISNWRIYEYPDILISSQGETTKHKIIHFINYIEEEISYEEMGLLCLRLCARR